MRVTHRTFEKKGWLIDQNINYNANSL